MALFMLGRIAQAFVAVLAILTILFFMLRLSGDPALLLAGPVPTPQVIAALHHRLGLDQPLWDQYLTFLAGLSRLDLGTSYAFNEPALPVVASRLPVSLLLVVVAQTVATAAALVIGTYAAMKASSASRWMMVGAFVAQSVPYFWLALLLVLVVSLQFKLIRPIGTPGTDGWSALVLPVAALSVPNIATLSRLVRSQVIDVMVQPYILTALSKGLPTQRVLLRHVMPNAFAPIVSWIAIQFSFMLGSLIILEPIFNYQGIGILMIQGVTGRDFSIVQSGVLIFAVLVIGANLTADTLSRLIDPRLRVRSR